MTLITPAYLEQQRAMHASPRGYGGGGFKHALRVATMATERDCRSVLDYGCGEGTLAMALADANFKVHEYDPAIPGKEGRVVCDLVVCTDVLEHVEPDLLPNVLTDIRTCARRFIYLAIATRPANKFLPDGRNAHLIVRDARWWSGQVAMHMSPYRTLAVSVVKDGGEVQFEVTP